MTDPQPETDYLIGMLADFAMEHLGKCDIRHRITWIDGQPLVVTRDHDPGRLNLVVENGKIVKVSRG